MSLWSKISLAILAGMISYGISAWVFQSAPVTTDENACVFQAGSFLDGRIARPVPLMPHIFHHEMIILDYQAGWLSRYPPGHALWLMPGVAVNQPRLMTALAAGLSVLVLLSLAPLLRIPAGAMLVLLAGCPYFIFMHGTLLSHTSGMLAAAAMLWAYVLWKETGRPMWALLSGLCWSFLFLNRTFTAALLAVPFGLHALWDLSRKPSRAGALGIAVFIAAAALGLAAYLGYNALATGNPLIATYLYYDPSEGLGFGLRHAGPNEGIHDFHRGLGLLVEQLALLNRWLFGFTGSLFAAAALAIIGWSRRWSLLLIAATASVWIGYIFFFARTINNCGPYYYFETLPFILAACGLGLARLWRWCAPWPRQRAVAATALALLWLGVSLAFMTREGVALRASQAHDGCLLRLIRSAPPHSLVITQNVWAKMAPVILNPRGLASDPLVVQGKEMDNQIILKVFGRRNNFILQSPQATCLVPVACTDPWEYLIGATQTHRYTGQNECPEGSTNAVRVAREGRDQSHWMACGIRQWLSAGRFSAVFDLDCATCATNAPVTLDVATNGGRRILAMQTVSGTQSNLIVRLDFTTEVPVEVEPRVHYGGSGVVTVRSWRLLETPSVN